MFTVTPVGVRGKDHAMLSAPLRSALGKQEAEGFEAANTDWDLCLQSLALTCHPFFCLCTSTSSFFHP